MDDVNETGPAPKRRILVVSQHFWPESFRINDIVEGLVAQGIEVDVLCGLPNYPKGEWFPGYRYTGPRREAHYGAQIFRSGEIRRKGDTKLRIFLNYCSFPLYALFNLPRLRGRKYDAVLSYETSPVLMILPAIVYAKTHRVPLVTYVLDLWPDNLYPVLPIKNKLLRALLYRVSRWHYRRSTRILALSEAQGQKLAEMCQKKKKPAPPIKVVPQYAEDFYAEDKPDAALAERFKDGFKLLFAGNLSPLQDLENLVRAVARLKDEPDAAALRVLILGDGMSRDELVACIEANNVAHRFELCGRVEPTDVPRWTGVADALYAGLAKSENLELTVPAKIASYMAAGRPLLVATGGAGEKAAAESGAALTSPPGDDAALAQNILAMLRTTPAQRAAMGQKARAYYEAHYKRDTLLARLRDFVLDGT